MKMQIMKIVSTMIYNLKRHERVKHAEIQNEDPSSLSETQLPQQINTDNAVTESISSILEKVNLLEHQKCFTDENVSLEMLLDMSENTIRDCLKDIGILRFGDRHLITREILKERSKTMETEKYQRLLL